MQIHWYNRRDYPLPSKECLWCKTEMEVYSNAQKYCQREDNPECFDDRHFSKLWNKGKHPLQKEYTNH